MLVIAAIAATASLLYIAAIYPLNENAKWAHSTFDSAITQNKKHVAEIESQKLRIESLVAQHEADLDKIEQLTRELAASREAISVKTILIDSTQADLAAKETFSTQAILEIAEKDVRIRALKSEVEELTKRLNLAYDAGSRNTARVSELERDLESANEELAKLREEVLAIYEKNELLRKSNADYANGVLELTNGLIAVSSGLSKSESIRRELRGQLDASGANLLKSSAQVHEQRQMLESQTARIMKLDGLIRAKENALKRKEGQLKAYDARLELAANELAGIRSKLSHAEREIEVHKNIAQNAVGDNPALRDLAKLLDDIGNGLAEIASD